jgi:signal transduction histidine kinase
MNLRDLPRLSADGPPRRLRVFGLLSLAVVLISTVSVEPRPGVHGDGPLVALGIVALVAGLAISIRLGDLPPGHRFAGLVIAGAASCLLMAVQPAGAGYAGIYYVVVVAGMRLPSVPALIAAGGTLGGELLVLAFTHDNPAANASGLVFSVVPWFLITRLIRQLSARRDRAEELVAELSESRAAHAEAATQAERGRVARDMHDVLAHSLSALALQLEGTRLLARDRGTDPDVIAGLERAHHLAASGLAEARQAIAALRGDDLPGPDRLQDLADAFAEQSRATCTLSVSGTPPEQSSEARLALYRTAQEALTNIRKHSAATSVEISLAYAREGVTLTISDHGPGAPVPVGAIGAAANGGYGLTGMRERAELLGGRLTTEPTADGFRVELWLPLPRAEPSSPLRS